MRIAYITETYPPELNGVALTVARTVRYLREQGHAVDLIRPRQPGEQWLDTETEWRTHSVPIPMYSDLRFGLAHRSTLRKRFARTRPQLVHIATQGPLGWAALQAARKLAIPVSSDFRTNFEQYSRYYRLGFIAPATRGYLRRFHNATQATFVPTQELRSQLEAQGFERLHVVGRGVSTERFDPARRDEALRAEWGVEGGPVLLYVGRLAVEKNVPLLFEAFDAARAARPDVKLVVVGDGPLREKLQARHPHALFLGARSGDALASCYASADLFVFPSLTETFGNVVPEALASGLATVAYRTAAAGALIVDGESGRLAAPGDEAAFIAAVVDLAARYPELQALREQAVKVAQSNQWGAVLQQFELHLNQTGNAYQASSDTDEILAQRSM